MRELTEATGLAAGGLYHYIESKEQLLIAICDELLDPLLERGAGDRRRADDAAGASSCATSLHAWLAHVDDHRDHMLVFAQERHVIEREPQWRRRARPAQGASSSSLDDVLARGERGRHDALRRPRLRAARRCSGWSTTRRSGYRPRGRLSPEQIADGYGDLILGSCRWAENLPISASFRPINAYP